HAHRALEIAEAVLGFIAAAADDALTAGRAPRVEHTVAGVDPGLAARIAIADEAHAALWGHRAARSGRQTRAIAADVVGARQVAALGRGIAREAVELALVLAAHVQVADPRTAIGRLRAAEAVGIALREPTRRRVGVTETAAAFDALHAASAIRRALGAAA